MADFWLIVFEHATGNVKNMNFPYKSGASEEAVKAAYSEKNQEVTVLMCGEGIENRPEVFEDLCFI